MTNAPKSEGLHSPCDYREMQFHEAVREMFRYQRSSADFFRRKMFVGYSKASSYVVRLEQMGFLGPVTTDGSARKITKTWAEWLVWLKAHDVPFDPSNETYQDPWPEDTRRPSSGVGGDVEYVRAYYDDDMVDTTTTGKPIKEPNVVLTIGGNNFYYEMKTDRAGKALAKHLQQMFDRYKSALEAALALPSPPVVGEG